MSNLTSLFNPTFRGYSTSLFPHQNLFLSSQILIWAPYLLPHNPWWPRLEWLEPFALGPFYLCQYIPNIAKPFSSPKHILIITNSQANLIWPPYLLPHTLVDQDWNDWSHLHFEPFYLTRAKKLLPIYTKHCSAVDCNGSQLVQLVKSPLCTQIKWWTLDSAQWKTKASLMYLLMHCLSIHCISFVFIAVFQCTSVCGRKYQWPPTDVTSLKSAPNFWSIFHTSRDDVMWFLSQDFLSDPGVPGVRSMGPDVSDSLTDYVQT